MAYRDSTINFQTGAVNLTVAVPTGVASGDIVFLMVCNEPSARTMTYPAGFAAMTSDLIVTRDGQRMGLAWKRTTGADSGTYAVTASSSVTDATTICVAFSGRHATNDPEATSAQNNLGTSPATVTATGLTAMAGDDLLWIAGGDPGNSPVVTGWTEPAGFTLREDGTGGWSPGGAATLDNVSAGATGDKSGTLTLSSNSAGWGAWLVRIPSSAILENNIVMTWAL